ETSPNRFGKSIDIDGDAQEELFMWDTDNVKIYTNTRTLPDGGRNLLLDGATITADSVIDAVYHSPDLIRDGDYTSSSSMWMSNDAGTDHWLEIDFGKAKTFDEIWLYGY